MMKLSTQQGFNKTLYNQINELADKIESGISADNFMYLTDEFIDVLKRTEKYDKENIPYDSQSTVNSYQVREVEQIIRYLRSMRVDLYQEDISVKLEEQLTSFRVPDGYTAFRSFVRLDDNWGAFRSNDGDETDEGLSKSISGQNIHINRYIDGISYDQAAKGKYRTMKGTIFYWRYL